MRSVNNDQLGYMGLLFVSVICFATTLASTLLLGWHMITTRVEGAQYNNTYYMHNGTSLNTPDPLTVRVLVLNPQEVTRQDLSRMADQMWLEDKDRLRDHELRLNLQVRVNTSNRQDKSKEELFQHMKFNIGGRAYTYMKFMRLLDNYYSSVKQPESYSLEEQEEINNFLLAVLETDLIKTLHRFFVDKGYIDRDVSSMKQLLYTIWFTLYNRSPKYTDLDSCGFEHIFVGETRGRKILGFHNWIQFYSQEKFGALDYNGYLSYSKPRVLNVQMTWGDHRKKQASMFVGVSPEFDLAMYTMCFVTRPGRECAFTMQQTNVIIQTYTIQHVEADVLATAFLKV